MMTEPGCSVRTCNEFLRHNECLKNGKPVTFHSFPQGTLKQHWIDACGYAAFTPNRTSSICSIHFESTFFRPVAAERDVLSQHAIPTLHLPTDSIETLCRKRRQRIPIHEIETSDIFDNHFNDFCQKYHQTQFIFDPENIINESAEIVQKSNNVANRLLHVAVKNTAGHPQMGDDFENPHEPIIQRNLDVWMRRVKVASFPESPLCYKCATCFNFWWHLEEFREHLRSHRKIDIRVECIDGQPYLTAFDNTADITANNNNYDCPKCGKEISYERNFLHCTNCVKQFKNKPGKKRFTKNYVACKICRRYFDSQDSYLDHFEVSHDVRSDVPVNCSRRTCRQCEELYVGSPSHHDCSWKGYPANCAYCSQSFTHTSNYHLHRKTNEGNIACELCGNKLSSKCAIFNHMLTHSIRYTVARKCILCDGYKVFIGSEGLRLHMSLEHRNLNCNSERYSKYIIIPKSCFDIYQTYLPDQTPEEIPMASVSEENNNTTKIKNNNKTKIKNNNRKRIVSAIRNNKTAIVTYNRPRKTNARIKTINITEPDETQNTDENISSAESRDESGWQAIVAKNDASSDDSNNQAREDKIEPTVITEDDDSKSDTEYTEFEALDEEFLNEEKDSDVIMENGADYVEPSTPNIGTRKTDTCVDESPIKLENTKVVNDDENMGIGVDVVEPSTPNIGTTQTDIGFNESVMKIESTQKGDGDNVMGIGAHYVEPSTPNIGTTQTDTGINESLKKVESSQIEDSDNMGIGAEVSKQPTSNTTAKTDACINKSPLNLENTQVVDGDDDMKIGADVVKPPTPNIGTTKTETHNNEPPLPVQNIQIVDGNNNMGIGAEYVEPLIPDIGTTKIETCIIEPPISLENSQIAVNKPNIEPEIDLNKPATAVIQTMDTETGTTEPERKDFESTQTEINIDKIPVAIYETIEVETDIIEPATPVVEISTHIDIKSLAKEYDIYELVFDVNDIRTPASEVTEDESEDESRTTVIETADNITDVYESSTDINDEFENEIEIHETPEAFIDTNKLLPPVNQATDIQIDINEPPEAINEIEIYTDEPETPATEDEVEIFEKPSTIYEHTDIPTDINIPIKPDEDLGIEIDVNELRTLVFEDTNFETSIVHVINPTIKESYEIEIGMNEQISDTVKAEIDDDETTRVKDELTAKAAEIKLEGLDAPFSESMLFDRKVEREIDSNASVYDGIDEIAIQEKSFYEEPEHFVDDIIKLDFGDHYIDVETHPVKEEFDLGLEDEKLIQEIVVENDDDIYNLFKPMVTEMEEEDLYTQIQTETTEEGDNKTENIRNIEENDGIDFSNLNFEQLFVQNNITGFEEMPLEAITEDGQASPYYDDSMAEINLNLRNESHSTECKDCRKSLPNYECSKCNVRHRTMLEFLYHIVDHSYKYFTCPECLQLCENSESVKQHVEEHVSNWFKYLADFKYDGERNENMKCHLMFRNAMSAFKDFFEYWESSGQNAASLGIDNEFQVLNDVIGQTNSHRQTKTKNCNICETHFSAYDDCKINLIEHLFTDANKTYYNDFKCQICQNGFETLQKYRQHMMKHKNTNISCPACSSKFNADNFQNDYMSNHFICVCCNMYFSSKSEYDNHISAQRSFIENDHNYTQPATIISEEIKAKKENKSLIETIIHVLYNALINKTADGAEIHDFIKGERAPVDIVNNENIGYELGTETDNYTNEVETYTIEPFQSNATDDFVTSPLTTNLNLENFDNIESYNAIALDTTAHLSQGEHTEIYSVLASYLNDALKDDQNISLLNNLTAETNQTESVKDVRDKIEYDVFMGNNLPQRKEYEAVNYLYDDRPLHAVENNFMPDFTTKVEDITSTGRPSKRNLKRKAEFKNAVGGHDQPSNAVENASMRDVKTNVKDQTSNNEPPKRKVKRKAQYKNKRQRQTRIIKEIEENKEKKFPKPTNCVRKCGGDIYCNAITEKFRRDLCNRFWSLNKEDQKDFLMNYITKDEFDSRIYHVTWNGTDLRVCDSFITATLDISINAVNKACARSGH